MIDKDTLDKYFVPEHPWVRGLFAEDVIGLGTKLDDASSRKLATLTGWKPRDDEGHRYHNALVMMNITPEDMMYYHMYDFVKSWGEKRDSLKRCGILGDEKKQCFDHFNFFQQFRRHNNKDLNVDDMISIAILVCYFSPRPRYNVNIHQTEFTKQGRRDHARATIEKGKALLEEDQYSVAQASSGGLSGPIETDDARASAKRIAQKRMDRQRTPTKTAREEPELSVTSRRASNLSISTPDPQRGSSPMSWTAISSSGKRRQAEDGSRPSGGKSRGLSGSAASTPAMTPRSRQSPQVTQPDSGSENEDFDTYMSRPRHSPDLAKELARMHRRAARSTAPIGTADSPLVHKGKTRTALAAGEVSRNEVNSPRSVQSTPNRVQDRQALWKNRDRATPKGKASAANTRGEKNQDEITTASSDGSEDESQRRDLGGRKQKDWAGDLTLSPTKRPKESPSAHPPSPTKKSRVSSMLTNRSITPLNKIFIESDDDDDDDDDGDDGGIQETQPDDIPEERDISDDEMQERQPDDTPRKEDSSDGDSVVPRPVI